MTMTRRVTLATKAQTRKMPADDFLLTLTSMQTNTRLRLMLTPRCPTTLLTKMLINHLGIWENAAIQIFCTTTNLETTRPQKYQDD